MGYDPFEKTKGWNLESQKQPNMKRKIISQHFCRCELLLSGWIEEAGLGLVGSGGGCFPHPHVLNSIGATNPPTYLSINLQLLDKNDKMTGSFSGAPIFSTVYAVYQRLIESYTTGFSLGRHLPPINQPIEPSFSTLFHHRRRSNRIVRNVNVATKNRCRDERSRDNANCHWG